MLTLKFSAQDLARTRFACSPLWEVVTSLQALKDPGAHALHLGWARRCRERLSAADVRFELLSALVPIPTLYVPDFLTPVPETEAPDIEAELATMLATTAERVRLDISRITTPLPRLVAAMYADPADGLVRLAAETREYWRVAIQPHWSRMQRLLEGEVLRRARMMARGGAAALFQELHPAVSWERGTLRVAHPGYEATRALDSGRGLVLVPSVFVWPGVFSQSNPPSQPGLVYPPRCIATLWERGRGTVPNALAGVLGRSRALLLTELASPVSTTELAARTDLAVPTVSHHLAALRDAGLATAHRTGRVVLYMRTEVAESLLETASGSDG